MASDFEGGWESEDDSRPVSLVVQLRQQAYVLPWSLFLFADGTDGQVRLTFHTHVVLVTGVGLGALLLDVATHSVRQLVEPDRTAKFHPSRSPQVTAVSVTENK